MGIAERDYQKAQAVLERLARSSFPDLLAPSLATHQVASVARDGMAKPAPAPAPVSVSWSEQMFRDLLEALPDAVAVINEGGIIVLVNAQTERMFGYTRAELLGHTIEMLVPDHFRHEHVDRRTEYFKEMRTRPMGLGRVLRGRRKNGEEFPVEISLSPLLTGQGPLATSVIRDVSQRMREEAQHKREEDKFRTLVENIPAVTFFAPLDDSAPELYVSPQIEELLGFSQREWIEDPVLWYRQLHPDDRERWSALFARTCTDGTPFRDIYRFKSKDGRDVWVDGSANLVRDRDGHPLYLQGVAFNVTSIKEAEESVREARESLRRLNADLEQRVVERTEALDRSVAELSERTEELEQFSYVASHDLREPLRTMTNRAQQLAKHYGTQLDEQANDWLQKTINGSKRMDQLIADLSLYGRVLGAQPEVAPTDCGTAAHEACANLQASFEDSGATITIGTLPTVVANHQQLVLLFQNLFANAVKFRAPDRSVHVEVGGQRDGDCWLVWVRDNGIGIEAKYLRKIFALGVASRLHSARKYPGTGVGLAICEKIVARHGGRIWAESEPGRGTTFIFTLPAVPLPLSPATLPLSPDDA